MVDDDDVSNWVYRVVASQRHLVRSPCIAALISGFRQDGGRLLVLSNASSLELSATVHAYYACCVHLFTELTVLSAPEANTYRAFPPRIDFRQSARQDFKE